MRWFIRATALIAAFAAATLQAQTPLAGRTWSIRDAPADMRQTIARADLIVASLQDALIRELREALQQGGPGFAIQSCHIDVIGVTQRIARDEGVAAGRTSDRLRSPMNAPKPWAAAIVKENAGRQARDVEGFAVDLGNRIGVLRPIAHRSMCNACHGRVTGFEPEVAEALKDRYPVDRATGFSEGEIRGWFWVEMPRQR